MRLTIEELGKLVAGLSDEYKAATAGEMPWSAIKAMRNEASTIS